jgi:hypothetical protein
MFSDFLKLSNEVLEGSNELAPFNAGTRTKSTACRKKRAGAKHLA